MQGLDVEAARRKAESRDKGEVDGAESRKLKQLSGNCLKEIKRAKIGIQENRAAGRDPHPELLRRLKEEQEKYRWSALLAAASLSEQLA